MKLIYRIVFLLALTLSVVSCDDLLDINSDPDRAPTARPQELLTSAQGYLSWVVDDRYNQQASLWVQYETWGPGVSLGDAERYVSEPIDYNNLWSRAYANSLADLKLLAEGDIASYAGVGKILEAYIFQGLVDHFGDVPFSNALQGSIDDGSVLAPTYDDDAAIYAGLIDMVNQGMADLEGESTDADLMGSNDLMFGGDLDMWLKFANSLKLRLLMRQSVQGGPADLATQINDVLNSSAGLIETGADLAKMDFAGTSGDENPMFAGQESGINYFYVASNAFFNVLDDLSDPRKAVIFNPSENGGTYAGIDQGDVDNEPFTNTKEDYSQISEIGYGAANSVIYMSPWEVWFLRAEAAARFGTSDDEEASWRRAILMSFNHLGLAPGTFIDDLSYDDGADLDTRIGKIAVQKWISMAGLQEDESWIEARRLDTPDNQVFTGNNGIFQEPTLSSLGAREFPSMFIYPESEQAFNTNAPTQQSITDKVFWDN